jgi:2-polyprenyl-6-hydroxyphenyl methylase/3-demethylubiquinone-9 3-methyltransferase
MEPSERPGADAAEIARFDALASQWWDPRGPMRPLHEMNPLRIGWIATHLRKRFGSAGVTVLDVGCGAGLAAEALARAGHDVLGVDAAGAAIDVAVAHGASLANPPRYRVAVAEDLIAEGARFQCVTALEVIEHVTDPSAFIGALAGLLVPGGLLFLSTLNRTARSFALAKVGAEYVLRMLPVGTHDWKQFLTPAELSVMLRRHGFRVADIAGMRYRPLAGIWQISRDLGVNYLLCAER